MWIVVRMPGICPSLAPHMKSLLAVSNVPFTPPKVEPATKRDITQAIGPNSLETDQSLIDHNHQDIVIVITAAYLLEKVIATASDPSTWMRQV